MINDIVYDINKYHVVRINENKNAHVFGFFIDHDDAKIKILKKAS